MALYRVRYGSFRDLETGEIYEKGDIVALTEETARFLGEQVEPAPDARAPTIDVAEIANNIAGFEIQIGDLVDVVAIREGYGPSDNTNDINVEAIERRYQNQ